MREDEQYLSPETLTSDQLRYILCKHDVEVPVGATNKTFLCKLYSTANVDQKIRQGWSPETSPKRPKRKNSPKKRAPSPAKEETISPPDSPSLLDYEPDEILRTELPPIEEPAYPPKTIPKREGSDFVRVEEPRRRPVDRESRPAAVQTEDDGDSMEYFYPGADDDEPSQREWFFCTRKFILLTLLGFVALFGILVFFYFSEPGRLPYCGTSESPTLGVCIQCPKYGRCHRMSYECHCPEGFVVSDDLRVCKEDSSLPLTAEAILQRHLKPAIQKRKGDFYCGDADLPEMLDREVEALVRLEYTKIAPDAKALSNFYAMYRHIDTFFEANAIYRLPADRNVSHVRFGTSDRAFMPISCSLRLFLWKFWFVLVPIIISAVFFACKTLLSARTQEVITMICSVLEEEGEKSSSRGVPIEELREDFCPYESRYSLNYYTWKEVKRLVMTDKRITHTYQLIGNQQVPVWQWSE